MTWVFGLFQLLKQLSTKTCKPTVSHDTWSQTSRPQHQHRVYVSVRHTAQEIQEEVNPERAAIRPHGGEINPHLKPHFTSPVHELGRVLTQGADARLTGLKHRQVCRFQSELRRNNTGNLADVYSERRGKDTDMALTPSSSISLALFTSRQTQSATFT